VTNVRTYRNSKADYKNLVFVTCDDGVLRGAYTSEYLCKASKSNHLDT